MGLSDSKEQELRRMPKVEFVARKSKDGKYIIHKTVITDIKPIAYYEKVLTNDALEFPEDVQETETGSQSAKKAKA